MIPAVTTVNILPERAALVLRLIERGRETSLPMTDDDRIYAGELALCLELLAGIHRSTHEEGE